MRRLLQNLVHNGIKHAPTGTTVAIEACVDADGLLLRVHDEGPGVPSGEVDRIFDVSLACTEAFANAIEHPRHPRADVIDVEGSVNDGTITVTVRDYGTWREARHGEGDSYGFLLMNQLMGRVEVDSQPDGTTVNMQRELPE